MDEQAASERDAIAPQPRTVGRASVPGLVPVRPEDIPAAAYPAAAVVSDENAHPAARIPLPRISEPEGDFGLPQVLRGAAEPLPRRRARSIQEFTDGPDPSSGGTPWSPFGAEEKPPPPQEPEPYRVRATARVPGALSPVDAQRADRILPDGPLIDELFFDGPPAAAPTPPTAADYAAELMREWQSEAPAVGVADADSAHDREQDDPQPHWPRDQVGFARPAAVVTEAGFSDLIEAGLVNSGRPRNVPPPEYVEDLESDRPPNVTTPPMVDSALPSVRPEHAAPIRPEPRLDRDDESEVPADAPLLGLAGDSFDDLSFDRTPFDRAPAEPSAPVDRAAAVEPSPNSPDLDLLYGDAPVAYGNGPVAEAPAYGVDAYWGSATPAEVAPMPRREPQPIDFGPEQVADAPVADLWRAAPSTDVPEVERPSDLWKASPSGRVTGDLWGSPRSDDAVDALDVADAVPPPVIGTVRAAVRVPGIVSEPPLPVIEDEDRPLAVPQALPVPPGVQRPEPALDGPAVTYAAEDWRSNVRGSAAVSGESGGTVYVVEEADDDDEDEPLSTAQKVLRSGVILLLIVLFVAAFRYGPNIDAWLHS